MPNRKEQNDKLIEASMMKVAEMEQNIVRNAMTDVMKQAYDYIRTTHKTASHEYHLNVAGGHAWVLLHNGEEVERCVSDGKIPSDHADAMIANAISKARKKGWVGVVMADMDSEVYQISFEKGVMNSALKRSQSWLESGLEKLKM